MVALAKVLKLHLHQLDVDSAFQYANLDEDIWMQPTPNMDIQSGYCLKLQKNLYGLKQAPRNWFHHIREFIMGLGFIRRVLDNCLYVLKHDGELFLLSLYVDDMKYRRIKFGEHKEFYGLPQAGKLSQDLLVTYLASHRYRQCTNTPCLFVYDTTNGIAYTCCRRLSH